MSPANRALGATLIAPDRCEFRVWSPYRDRVELRIDSHLFPMKKNADGYHEATIEARPGTHYSYVLDGVARPDPASRYQPESVHGPSEVVSRDFDWHDAQWKGIALEDHVLYELHVGTFTPEGTFEAIIAKLDALKDLGITAIELLPIGQFPGTRNWGYDGVYISAAQNSYGGPLGLKRLVDAAHQRGLAVILDVVYNHLGPEGNYLREFGPYFTDRYKTPWGQALNFDGPHSDHVRWFFIHNALMWIDEFHVDALRVDAVHAIIDHSAEPFLQDLTTAVRDRARELGRRIYMIAESDLNDPRVITPKESLGLGFDSQWSDDLHHSLHALLTPERTGYYVGYGKTGDLARAISTGYLYTGQHSVYRGRKYGLEPKTKDGAQFIVYAQNHDQVGNRMHGERLSTLVSPEKVRLAAAVVILSPFLPMLFMGEEYGETAPFQYFTSHSDEDLINAVRRGRREEFDDFEWVGEAPDPHAEDTFLRSKLRWKEDASLRDFYRQLLRLRRETPALRSLDLRAVETRVEGNVVLVRRGDTLVAFNFSDKERAVEGHTLAAWGFRIWSCETPRPA
ncbi:MAG TPA: malto-oligosyltrehalose trehalohydrolase [Thermoanaerobaculia bacterium]|nr:malto-oligosyltrehalose trehalohydrolase [Thermoanaerobaculia bacterium]